MLIVIKEDTIIVKAMDVNKPDNANFTREDIHIIELGARVFFYLYFENTGTEYNRLAGVKGHFNVR